MNKAYIIVFDKSLTDNFDYVKFHKALTEDKGIINWWHYLESAYIIITNPNVTSKNISDFMLVIMPEKSFFTCELKLRNYNGYLQPKAWDWINFWMNQTA